METIHDYDKNKTELHELNHRKKYQIWVTHTTNENIHFDK